MGQDNQVIIFQPLRSLPHTLAENLHAKGFRNRTVAATEEILNAYDDSANPVLLVDGGASKKDTKSIIERLLKEKALYTMPVLLVAPAAQEFEKELAVHYQIVEPLNSPCSPSEIFSKLHYIVDVLQKEARNAAFKSWTAIDDQGGLGINSVTGPKIEEQSAAAKQIASIFDALKHLQLSTKKLGGEVMNTTDWSELATTEDYMKARSQTVQSLLSRREKHPRRRVRRQIRRSAYVTSRILKTLDLKDDQVKDSQEAGLLYFCSQAEWPDEEQVGDFLKVESPELRMRLSKHAAECAKVIEQEAGFSASGKILVELSGLFLGEMNAEHNEAVISAAAIMAADIMNRYCAPRGIFDPTRAYDFVSSVRKGVYSVLPMKVLCCLLKIVLEAVSAVTVQISMRATIRSEAEGEAIKKQPVDTALRQDEIRVEISGLSPGMKISRPVVTLNGETLLQEGTVLDPDVVWRLWQLMAIRPMGDSVVIRRDFC